MNWTPEEEEAFLARRKKRNIAIAVVLAMLAVLFYVITVSRMQG